MTIKEVEQALSVSRANIRFYEKEGLLTTSRKSNNYRDYTEENLKELKKIILFRKLGFTIEDIKKLQSGEMILDEALTENISRLEKEIETLEGALKLTKRMSKESPDFQTMDENYYFDLLTSEEQNGAVFEDIWMDYLIFARDRFDSMWKIIFFHDFKQSRKKHGWYIATGFLFLSCLIRGLSRKFIWGETFWEGFLYPFAVFLGGMLLITPVYILGKKVPKAGAVVASILLVLCLVFLAGILLLLIVLLLNAVFHFWF